jgi:hypothetical protein
MNVSKHLFDYALVVSGIIEIPRSLLPSEMTTNNTPSFVSVRALSRVECGTRVDVEPLTTEDWELLEVHAEDVERGDLLSQVSVVYAHQILSLYVGNQGDKVKIRVKAVQTASSMSDSSIWPDVVNPDRYTSNSEESRTAPSCVLLVQNTRMIVLPKPKHVKKMPTWTSPLRLIPSEVEWGEALDILLRISDVQSFHCEPWAVLVNAEQWPHNSEWSRVKPARAKSTERNLRVVVSTIIPLGHAGMFLLLGDAATWCSLMRN